MISKLQLVLVGAMSSLTVLANNPPTSPKMPGFEPVEAAFREELKDVPDVPGLPRVLLIGDSISISYTRGVRSRLEGRANVHRPPENCGDTSYGLDRLRVWLGAGPWAVIHFNFGLHDLKYLDAAGNYTSPEQGGRQVASPTEYAGNLRMLLRELQQTGAKIIFATTTPVPAGASGRVAGSEQAYNDAARAIMREAGIGVDDLHAFAVSRGPVIQLPHNVHFTAAGNEELANVVAGSILSALPPPPPAP